MFQYTVRWSTARLANLFEDFFSKFSINFEDILSRAHGNFEEQNTVLESSIN
jgi:hypothetical protein